MSLYKRGDVWGADLREYGAGRYSLFTESKDVAKLLHNELEQRVLRGETINRQVVKSLHAALASPRLEAAAVAIGAATGTSPIVALQAKQRAGITLTEAFLRAKQARDEWSESKSPRTIEGNFKHVAEHFGRNKQLCEITSSDCSRWRAMMKDAGLSASTINQRMSMLSVIFSQAEEDGHPVEKPRLKRFNPKGGMPRRRRTLGLDEERTVIAYFAASQHEQDQIMADLVPCLIDTGFRLGEMLAVMDRVCINWDTGMVGVLGVTTKSNRERWVPMYERTAAILKRRCKASSKPFEGLTVDSADHRWAKMRTALKYPKDDAEFVIHALRHTCATRLAEQGENAFTIKQWLGHASITTSQIYVDLAAHSLKAARDRQQKSVTERGVLGLPVSVPQSVAPMEKCHSISQTD